MTGWLVTVLTVFITIEMLSHDEEKQLLIVARKSILHGLENGSAFRPDTNNCSPALLENLAVFVTLKIDTRLRGCIGTLEFKSPLIKNVAEYAYRAAFHDPRFKPLEESEFASINISISILTPRQVMEFNSEKELLDQLKPGTDGLVIEKGHAHATFLPAVWETLPDARDFLRQLKIKAKIPEHETPDRAWRYQSSSITEN